VALAVEPATWTAAAWVAVAGARALLDGAAGSALRPGGFRPAQLLRVPGKDLILGLAWIEGFLRRTVNWRGTRLRVLPGTRLAPPGPPG
jgi:ceramide glucosyltransferase